MISGGIGAFAPQKIDKPGVSDFEGRGVFYFVKDKRPFRAKKVLVVGGGDTAVDWCLNLKDWAKEITLIHRREQFRAHEASLAALRESRRPDHDVPRDQEASTAKATPSRAPPSTTTAPASNRNCWSMRCS